MMGHQRVLLFLLKLNVFWPQTNLKGRLTAPAGKHPHLCHKWLLKEGIRLCCFLLFELLVLCCFPPHSQKLGTVIYQLTGQQWAQGMPVAVQTGPGMKHHHHRPVCPDQLGYPSNQGTSHEQSNCLGNCDSPYLDCPTLCWISFSFPDKLLSVSCEPERSRLSSWVEITVGMVSKPSVKLLCKLSFQSPELSVFYSACSKLLNISSGCAW